MTQLFVALRTTLRRRASRILPSDSDLTPTDLMHTTYGHLSRSAGSTWQGPAHFVRYFAKAMKSRWLDRVRWEGRKKRGGDWRKLSLTDVGEVDQDLRRAILTTEDVEALSRACDTLRKVDDRAADVIRLWLRDLSDREIAITLGVSLRTVERKRHAGVTWLRREFGER